MIINAKITRSMTPTQEKLQAELKTAKLRIKFAECILLILEAFKERELYKFTSPAGTKVELFISDEISMCGLTMSFDQVKDYDDFHILCFKEKPKNTKELRSALRYVEKHWKNIGNIFYDLLEESKL